MVCETPSPVSKPPARKGLGKVVPAPSTGRTMSPAASVLVNSGQELFFSAFTDQISRSAGARGDRPPTEPSSPLFDPQPPHFSEFCAPSAAAGQTIC